jgi:hypothetical protein
MTHDSIKDHIDQDLKQLSDPSINSQRKRFLESELEDLNRYRENHPDDDHDPSPLELYCDANPNALECRIYED